jgi:hypothetical protein
MEIARYFSIPEDRLTRAVALVESAERPEILLLQNPDQNAKVGAAVMFSSVWSKAYAQFGTPYGRVHRDFHYQVMFSALAALVEVGCDRMRIDHPMPGHQWRGDAYVCLLEATRNIRANMRRGLSVWLREGEYDPVMPKEIENRMLEFDLGEHRPVGISPHVFEGLNMRTVFVEKAVDALRKARVPAP